MKVFPCGWFCRNLTTDKMYPSLFFVVDAIAIRFFNARFGHNIRMTVVVTKTAMSYSVDSPS